MPIFRYVCKKCNHEQRLFSHRELKCKECNSKELKKLRSTPLRDTEKELTDKWHNVHAIPGIEKDLKARNRRDFQKKIKETIEEQGEKIAREQGWIDKDGNIRKD